MCYRENLISRLIKVCGKIMVVIKALRLFHNRLIWGMWDFIRPLWRKRNKTLGYLCSCIRLHSNQYCRCIWKILLYCYKLRSFHISFLDIRRYLRQFFNTVNSFNPTHLQNHYPLSRTMSSLFFKSNIPSLFSILTKDKLPWNSCYNK